MRQLFGVIEGFYGRQWQWQQRSELLRLLPTFALNAYLYAPKGDPFLRNRWRENWPSEMWRQLQQLSSDACLHGVSFGVGLSLIDYSEEDEAVLVQKIQRLNELALGHLGIFFDDMRGDDPQLLQRQLQAVALIRRYSEADSLYFCPTYYTFDPVLDDVFGKRPEGYWPQLASQLHSDVACFWTGPKVCSPSLYASDIDAAKRVLHRPPTIWDNYPVNDGRLTSRFLHLRPLTERSIDSRHLGGYFMNPMNQFELSLPVIASLRLGLAGNEAASEASYQFAVQRWGESFAEFWQSNTALVQDVGLDGMSSQQRNEQLASLKKFDNLAAQEWSDWLTGGYNFDPACLT